MDKTLKLYILGQSSPNPQNWSEECRTTLVAAHSEEEARELCGDTHPYSQGVEIELTQPCIVFEIVPDHQW